MKKPIGYWGVWENVERAINKVIKKNKGVFPTQKEMYVAGFPSLPSAVTKYYGGLNSVREKMGYKLSKKHLGYWKNFENIKSEMKKAIKENDGEFPSQRKLNKMDKKSLISAMQKYYGGINAVKIKMGYELETKPMRYWQKEENIKRELNKAIGLNNGEFLTQRELTQMGLSGMLRVINKKYGGLGFLREKMGYNSGRKPNGHWKNWENFKSELERAIGLNNGKFPTQDFLEKIGLSSLYQYFGCHGGINVVRKKMDYELETKPPDYWQRWENFEPELKEAIELNNGEFLSQRDFSKMRLSSIAAAITNYHGGFAVVREKIGYNEKMRVELARDLEGIARELVA